MTELSATAPDLDLSVVIPSYNTRELMEQALRTVQEASGGGLGVEIIVVDNASHDGSPEMVAESFPDVELIVNEANLGFAAACNQAFRRVRGRYILLLNSDTIVRPDTLRRLVEFLDQHPEAGAAGCKILNPDGTLQLESRRGFPTPAGALYKLAGLSRLFPQSRRFGHYNLTYLDPEQVSEVDALSGSCMMVRRDVLEQVGLLDEAYFMYGEDLDWCYRMRQAGWIIYYTPNAEIIHFKGESGRSEQLRVEFRKREAMVIFVRKHMKGHYPFFSLSLLQVGIVLYGLVSFLRPLSRRLALPFLDGALVLSGLKLGLVLRYHPSLIPVIRGIEAAATRFGLDVHPTLWLTPPPYSEAQWLAVYGGSTTIWLVGFVVLGLYDRRRYSPLWAAGAVALGFGGIVTTVFFFKAYNFSRLAAGAAWVFNTLFVAGWRLGAQGASRIARRRGLSRRRMLIVGTDAPGVQLAELLQQRGGLDGQLIGLVAMEPELRGRLVSGIQVVGLVEELASLVKEYRADELVFTDSTVSQSLRQVSGGRWRQRLRLRLVTGSFADLVAEMSLASVDDLPLVEIGSRQRPLDAGG